MLAERREQVSVSLRKLAEAHRATMTVLEHTLALLCEVLALDPHTYLQTRLTAPRTAIMP